MFKSVRIVNIQQLRTIEYSIRDFAITVLLLLLCFILLSNIYRAIEKGEHNLQVFASENQLLYEYRERNDELRKRLELMALDENTLLLARRALGYAKENEEVFRLKEDAIYYDIEKRLMNSKNDVENRTLWSILIFP